jgi:hypothetical protein
MKLTNIALYSNGAEVANFSFRDPRGTNPYLARGISGLNSDEIISKFSGLANTSGSKHFNLGMKDREIVMLISLNPQFALGKSYSDLRDDLYRAVASSRTGVVQVRFNNGLKTIAAVKGFVKKFDSNLFSEKPQVQLTIRCEDPWFRALERTPVPSFKLTDSMTINNAQSTAPHGFRFGLTVDENITTLTVQDAATPEWSFVVTPGTISANTGFLAGDKVYFSSEANDRYFYIVRSATTIQLVDRIEPGSVWPVMFPGDNNFVFSGNGGFTIDYLDYYATYWGV